IARDLPQPTNVKIAPVASSGAPKVTWDAVEGASKYEIYRKVGSSGTYAKYDTTTGTSYTNSSTTPGTIYYYKVLAVCGTNSGGNSALSKEVYIARDLPQPTNVKIAPVVETGKPKVTWDGVEGASKYEIWRKVGSSGTYAKYDTTTGTSYINSSTTPGTIYYYKVLAVCGTNSGGNSALSKEVYMACDLAQPQVSIALSSAGKPKVSWKAVSGASKYEIWRKVGSTGTYAKYDTTTNTSYTNTSATAGTTYYYQIKAICSANSGGNSAKSTAVSITSK
ncbi:MAG: hypothetical protein U0K95_05680, partial [Eubacterium sp.]|nr:hypothetical protein [Eubacterium sp.]